MGEDQKRDQPRGDEDQRKTLDDLDLDSPGSGPESPHAFVQRRMRELRKEKEEKEEKEKKSGGGTPAHS